MKDTRATQREYTDGDDEYTDIILGGRHILLFTLIVGALLFGSGYFVGRQQSQSGPGSSAATSVRDAPTVAQTTAQAPIVIPEVVRDPLVPPDIVEDLESISTASLTAGKANGKDFNPGAPAVIQTRPSRSPREGASTQPSRPQPRSTTGAETIYLKVSTVGQDAQQLANDLAGEGFRAVIDGTFVANRQTVLVGPFRDLDTAAMQAKELRERNVEAFPVRR